MMALFSGTYNEYYDLRMSVLFMDALRSQITIETHWARPNESNKEKINVGEERVLLSTQSAMAQLIPNYSFRVNSKLQFYGFHL